jgi:hypothetical protein
MKTIHLQLVLDVEFDPQGDTVQELTSKMNQVVRNAVNNGTLTGDSPATVEKHFYTVKEIKPKAKRIRRKAGQHSFADCGGYPRCVTCGKDEDDAFVGGEECSFGNPVQPTCQCGSRLFNEKGDCQKCGL